MRARFPIGLAAALLASPAWAQLSTLNPIQATSSAPINIATATTTQLIPLAAGKVIYIIQWNVIAAGAGNFTLEYGSGTNCATNPTPLTGPYPLVAAAGLSSGSGMGPILIVPLNASLGGQALCAVTSTAVQMSGSIAYSQF